MDQKEEAIIQNLKDAGCDLACIEDFVAKLKQESKKEAIQALKQHRRCLLEVLHGEQKKIDCLDYLIFTLIKDWSKK